LWLGALAQSRCKLLIHNDFFGFAPCQDHTSRCHFSAKNSPGFGLDFFDCGAIAYPVHQGSVTPFEWVVFASNSRPGVARSAVSYKFATLGKFFEGVITDLVTGIIVAAIWVGHGSFASHRTALIF